MWLKARCGDVTLVRPAVEIFSASKYMSTQLQEGFEYIDCSTFKYHVLSTDGKISVRIKDMK